MLNDGTQQVEFLHFGHSHTPGDAVAYLPKHKILCTGDACVNGAFNYMGHSNSASGSSASTQMAKLDIDLICPGHGTVTGKDLLGKQKRYFAELRRAVKKGIDAKKSLEDITVGHRHAVVQGVDRGDVDGDADEQGQRQARLRRS